MINCLKKTTYIKTFAKLKILYVPLNQIVFYVTVKTKKKIIYNLNTTEIYIGENLKIITVNFKSLRTHIEKTHHMWTVSYLLKRIAVVPLYRGILLSRSTNYKKIIFEKYNWFKQIILQSTNSKIIVVDHKTTKFIF